MQDDRMFTPGGNRVRVMDEAIFLFILVGFAGVVVLAVAGIAYVLLASNEETPRAAVATITRTPTPEATATPLSRYAGARVACLNARSAFEAYHLSSDPSDLVLTEKARVDLVFALKAALEWSESDTPQYRSVVEALRSAVADVKPGQQWHGVVRLAAVCQKQGWWWLGPRLRGIYIGNEA